MVMPLISEMMETKYPLWAHVNSLPVLSVYSTFILISMCQIKYFEKSMNIFAKYIEINLVAKPVKYSLKMNFVSLLHLLN